MALLVEPTEISVERTRTNDKAKISTYHPHLMFNDTATALHSSPICPSTASRWNKSNEFKETFVQERQKYENKTCETHGCGRH